MKAKIRNKNQGNFLYPDLMDQLNPSHPLLKLAKKIPWQLRGRIFQFLQREGTTGKAHPAHGRVDDPQADGKFE